jgi:hypothetical protein
MSFSLSLRDVAFLRQPAFSPLSIPDLHAWFDAATGFPGKLGNSTVDTWPDMTGNGHDATQGVPTVRPIYQTGVQNGLPVVQFTGDDNIQTGAWSPHLAQPNTVLCVGRTDNTEGQYAFFWDGHTSNLVGRNALFVDAGPNPDVIKMFAGIDTASAPNVTASGYRGAFHLFTCHFNQASSALRIDGVQVATGDVGTQEMDGVLMGAYLGGGATFLTGYIAELLVYSRTLTSGELADLEAHLMAKWGLA